MKKLLPLLIVEHGVKEPIWGCKMCGQCILHSTGMTCPMTCPKTLRNGPCGGVREDGNCEVDPNMRCVWVKAEKRRNTLPLPKKWREEFDHIHPPVDNQLAGSSSWVNLVSGRDRKTPRGWNNQSTRGESSENVLFLSLVELDDTSLPES